ncbi:MAG: amino acid adenylation domain-containing protein, partial [bacterium]|nr:amino acid adenylation domain-containing protein [bacterium]
MAVSSKGEHKIRPYPSNGSITYMELNRRADVLAYYFKKNHGIRNGEPVAIMMEPGLEMVIGILGILKSGGAYLPIDPE